MTMQDVIEAVETPQQAARRLSAPALRDGFRPEALHAYTDTDGTPVYWRIRLKHSDGRKWIRPMRLTADGSGYENGEPAAPQTGKPIYNKHGIARSPDAVVIVVEGEKGADALVKLGLAATTSGSASSADSADWTPLAGRSVLIWPDHDEPGAQYARDVADKLRALGCDARIIDAAALDLPPKGDAADWCAAHAQATADDVLALPVIRSEVADQWPQPQPLPAELAPVEPFDPELLPEALRDWVMDIADRVSCPPDYVAVPAMLALSCVLGRKIGVRPQRMTDWTVIPNLWGLVIGRPGAMKSPAMAQATAPIKRLAARAQDEFDAAMADWQRAERLRKLQEETAEKEARKVLHKDPRADVSHLIDGEPAEPEPILRRYATSQVTMEAVAELLRFNPQGMMLERDEIMGLLRELDKPEKADFRAFMLETWDGAGSFTVDRIGRGFNLHVPAMCLSMIGTTQPGRIKEYVRDALRGGGGDDGLVQRFSMAVWPDATGDWRNVDRWPDGAAKKAAFAVFDRLDKLKASDVQAEQDNDMDGNPEGVPYLRLADDALELFTDWRAVHEARLRDGDLHPAMEAHLAKYRKLVPALALICHLADNGAGPVAEAAMLRSLAWAGYLESHARRIYGGAIAAEIGAARAILSRIKRGDVDREGFTARDIYRKQWAGLDDPELVQQALAYLVEMDWLRERIDKGTTGRPTAIYTANPRGRT